MGGAQAADAGDSKAAALHFAGSQLTITRFFGDGGQFTRQLGNALLVHVFEDRNNQTIRGINRYTDVDVFLQRQLLTIFGQGAVKARHLLKCCSNGFHDEDNWGEFHIQFTLLSFGVLLFTERFQIGDIGFIEVRNVRDHHPVTAEVSTRDFLDAAQFHFFDFAKLAEVDFRPRQHARNTTASSGSRCGFCAFHGVFHVSLNVFAQDTAFTAGAFDFRQVNAELARQAADQRCCVNVCVVFSKLGFAFCFSRRSSRFFRFGSRGRCSRFLLSSRGSGRCRAFHFEDHNQRAGRHFVAGADFDFFHHARERRRYFHRGFVAFYGDK